MFSQIIKNSSLRQYILFSLVFGLFVSTYLVQFHLLTQQTNREKTGVSWVHPAEKSKNAYFRYELPLAFSPKQAWI